MRARTPKNEVELIDAFAGVIDRAAVRPKGLVVGVGDDTAVVRPGAGKDTLITKDVQVEGRHFERSWLTGRELGWRLASVNLSDVAAMGGEPRFALLSLVVPPGVGTDYLVDLVRGVVGHLAKYGAALVGGNVSATGGPLVCDLTLSGVCASGKAWKRSARAGDAIVVAGELGAAAAGLELYSARVPARMGGALRRAYKRPEPRVDVARLLRGNSAVHGAIDVSDGLSSDLIHVCRSAGLGCEVHAYSLPVARAAKRYCSARGRDPVEWAMRGGEDYALVLCTAPTRADAICERVAAKLGIVARVVGRFTRSKGEYRLQRSDGTSERFESAGWDHLA